MASQATLDRLCAEFDSPPEHITAAVGLLEQNATPAFLSRYRRYEFGNIPEDRLVILADRLHALTELEQRRATILEQAEERGRKTPELEATLAMTADQDLLDDYYQSMRPRRRGIAMQMEEKGLAPLALAIQHRQFGDAATEIVPRPRVADKPAEKPAEKAKQETKPAEAATAEQKPASEDTTTNAEVAEDAAAPTPEVPANQAAAPDSEDAATPTPEVPADEAAATDSEDAATPTPEVPADEAAATDSEDAAAPTPEVPADEAAATDSEVAPTDETAQEPEVTESAEAPLNSDNPAEAVEAAAEAPAEAPAEVPAEVPDEPAKEAASENAPEVLATEPTVVVVAQGKKVPDVDLAKLAEPYISEENGITTVEAALEGALLILADRIIHSPTTRARFREEMRRGILRAKPVNPDGNPGRYKQFFDFAEPINRIPSSRMLALRRAEREKILHLELTLKEGRHRKILRELHAKDTIRGTQLGDFYDLVFDNANKGLQSLCGNDVRRRLKEKADREAMRTYGRNLRSQLLAPPLGSKKVLSLRSSGKAIWVVTLNEDGSIGEHKTIPTDSDEQKEGAIGLLVEMIKSYQPHAIALPHGRRQAGSEKIVAKLREALGEDPMPMVVPVDEAASTIFATSTTGKKAIPGVEVGIRTAVSLGRRLQDPLLELARMEVRTLGLGQTLDDVHQGTLQRELGRVKSGCIAEIGCDLNTSNTDVLQMLPGLGNERAQAIIKHRKRKGGFANRAALQEVEGINEACYRNIAGFVRLTGGDEPLDATPIHPDDYTIAKAAAEQKGCEPIELLGKNLRDVNLDSIVTEDWPKPRVIGVLQQLGRAGKDSRGELIDSANEGVHTLTDLHQDRELKGRVTSTTDFGAFIDLGIGQDGLVHISQIPGHRMRDPNQMLRVGEVIIVWVLNVDQEKGKISLSMHKPRHLAEGRLPTLGERMDQGKGRRRGGNRGGPREQAQEGRRPGAASGRPGSGGSRRGAPGGGRDGGRDGGGRGFGGGRDGDRGPRRGGGSREQRVYTIEPEREIEEQLTEKGEATSLASLRNLLGKSSDDKKKD